MSSAQQDCEAMEKTGDAFRTISEAAEELDLPQHVLRFWETRFPQIRPLKRGGGRRYYRPDDVQLLRAIRHLLYSEGYTIKGVQRMLKERGVRAVLAMNGESGAVALTPASEPALPRDAPALDAPSHSPESDTYLEAELAYPAATAHAPGAPYTERTTPDSFPEPPQQAPVASVWTAERRRKLEALVAELAECRRILGAASI